MILLHAGKGGGLSDMFGGFSGGGAGGTTIVQRNLDRITVFASLAFAFTTVWLTFLWR